MQLWFGSTPKNVNAQIKLLQHITNSQMNNSAKIMGLCTRACLSEQSQPWALPNIGPGLDSIQLNSSQLDSAETPWAHSRSQAPTHKYSRIDDQNLYECKSALCYNRIQFMFISFTIKLQSNKNITQVMYMFNLFYWAVIYRVVHIFTLLHKMNWVAGF